MSKKLTISIPDDLHKRLENFRDRIAISNVCSEALRSAMDSLEDIDINVLDAMKRFNIISLKDACSLAKNRGKEWAGREATPEELAIVCLYDHDYEAFQSLEEYEIMSNKVKDLIKGSDEIEDFVQNKGYVDDLLSMFKPENPGEEDIDCEDIIYAFIDGARVVWKEIDYVLLPKLQESAKQNN